jgi:hypothetical protein
MQSNNSMSQQIYIYHHLGLGDHFHCNGVVRFLLNKKYKSLKVRLFSKKKYSKMIKFMYRDLNNLEIVPITDDEKKENDEVNSILNSNDILEKIGFDYFLKYQNKKKTIDMLFYEQYNIDYSERFKLTYWKRDLNKEKKLFKELVHNEDYVFVHDDPIRGFVIPDSAISKNFQIIRNSYLHSIFDYGEIIENSKEIHVMESSARCMLEYLNTKNSKHFLYDFVGGPWKSIPFINENNEIIGSSKKWKIIKIDYLSKKSIGKRIKKIFNFNR